MIVLFSAWRTMMTQTTVRYVKKKAFQMKSKSHQAFEHKASECATRLFFFFFFCLVDVIIHTLKETCVYFSIVSHSVHYYVYSQLTVYLILYLYSLIYSGLKNYLDA